MTITELLDLFCDAGMQEITIWSCEREEEIFTGTYDDFQYLLYDGEELEDYEIVSIDNIDKSNARLTINVE